MSKPSFLAELQRRNVLRAGVLYAGAVWALAQGLAQLLPLFGDYEWVARWFVIAAIIGFPFWIAFAWFYEFTPQGLKRESELVGDASIARSTGRTLDKAIIAVLAIAVVLLLTNIFVWRKGAGLGNGSAPANSNKSIAVLPFENLSSDKDNAFFADGMQDLILTKLADIGDLKVISRTSTAKYESHPDNLKTIAQQLGVSTILEGSVQKAGNQVLINVQLIDAATDAHLWAEAYPRTLDNVFGVESEVATAIADALDATLSPREKTELARKPTTNAAAWEAYLHGLSLADRPDIESTDQIAAATAFGKAVQLDPDFAVAWAALSTVDAGLVFTENDTSAARRDAAKAALAQAVRLQPSAFETRRAQAYYAYFIERDYDGARAIFEQIRRLAPSDAEIPRALALIARRQNRWDDSMRLFDEALAVDPRNVKVLMWAADNHTALRQFPQALRLLDRVTDVVPGDKGALAREAGIVMAIGDLDRAQAIIERMGDDPGASFVNGERALLLRLQHRYADGVALSRRMVAETDATDLSNRGYGLLTLAEFQRLGGDTTGAKTSYMAARDILRRVMLEQPDTPPLLCALAMVESGLGHRDAALAAVQHAINVLPASKDALLGPTNEEALARVEARIGDRDAAIAGLQHLLATPYQSYYDIDLTPATLRLDPDFDALRSDPRFQKLAGAPDAPTKAARQP